MVRYMKNSYKLVTDNELSSAFKKSLLLRNRNNNISTIKLDLRSSICLPVYIHYGPICLKKNALFFPDAVIIRGKYYTLNNAQFNDWLFEIRLSKKTLRIEFLDSYNTIKNLHNYTQIVCYSSNL